MKIGVLTYDVKHRKTYDILSLLKAVGYSNVIVYAIPMHYVKKRYPLYEHRPELINGMPLPDILCKNLNFTYEQGELDSFNIEKDRVMLIGGAGILPIDFVKKHIIINSHPGYIPLCRGLDSFKWAIINNQPIGVTTHLLGEYIDAGYVIERKEIKVYLNDTFHSLANRVYENEVSMLVDAIKKYNNTNLILPNNNEIHKRMPSDIEKDLLVQFEKYKKVHAVERER